MLSTNFDWKSESLKVWKSESRKVWKSEMLSDSKNFFSSFFLDQVEPKSEKKNKSENFEKFGHFLLPVLRNKAQWLTPSGIRRYKRRGTKVRSPRSARSTAPWKRRRRLTPILQINFEVSGKHFTSRYYFKKFRNFWAIRSWKLGGKNTFLGARGQGGHRRGSTLISRKHGFRS